jgi:iron uptake system component EfeO
MDQASPRRTRLRSTAAGLAAVALTLSACGGSDDSGTAGSAGAPPDAATTEASRGAHLAQVTITADKGCVADPAELAAGGITFKVSNLDATSVSEVELLDRARIVGEKENVPPGLDGEFAVNLDAGTYTLYCPGATPERSTISVTGKAAAADHDAAALLQQATQGWSRYVEVQSALLVRASKKLDAALRSGDLAAAQDAYKQARPFYEKIEPVAESFAIGKDSLDADIDSRAGDVPAGQWRGFHRIEKGLFADRSLAGLAPYGARLVSDTTRLQKLTGGLTYKAPELANGAQELLDEVASSKVTGEEERYSHIDMLDFASNDEGSQQAFAQLQPILEEIDPSLSKTIQERFDSLNALVDTYRSDKDASGFVLYGQLAKKDKRKLAAAVKAVQEPLSLVASKVAGVG